MITAFILAVALGCEPTPKPDDTEECKAYRMASALCAQRFASGDSVWRKPDHGDVLDVLKQHFPAMEPDDLAKIVGTLCD